MFAIDQQQYLQGYLPVVFAVLYVTNLNTIGNGQPVLTGPGIINKANAAQVAKLASEGHSLGVRDAGAGGCGRPPRTGGAIAESATETAPSDERLTRVSPLVELLARPDIGAMIGALAVWLAFGYFASNVNWIGDLSIDAIWTDQAAQYGIVAVPVALLMIGGEFDLSAGVMIGSSGLLLGYLTTFHGLQHLAGDRRRDAVRGRRRPAERRAR